jgi:hypothetical protein
MDLASLRVGKMRVWPHKLNLTCLGLARTTHVRCIYGLRVKIRSPNHSHVRCMHMVPANSTHVSNEWDFGAW